MTREGPILEGSGTARWETPTRRLRSGCCPDGNFQSVVPWRGGRLVFWWSLLILLACIPASLTAASADWLRGWEFSGYAEAEARVFPESPLDGRQFEHADLSLAFEPELYRRWDDSRAVIKPFLRLDLEDPERTHFDLREFLWSRQSDYWDGRVGVGKVFWGVTESRHLVDVVNQTDLIENVDGEDKLGQPMLNVAFLTEAVGTFSFFYLPYFRERTFPGIEGRLRPQVPIDTQRAHYESEWREWHPDASVRWSYTLGEIDVGTYYFYGTSRDPLFRPVVRPDGELRLEPHYNLMHQVGLDLQWTHEGWLWKLESILREGKGQHFQALVGGFEYTLYGLWDSDADVGLLSEYHYDNRDELSSSFLDREVFVGARLARNDPQDTTLLGGAFYDYRNGSSSARLEFERRLGSRYVLQIEAQVFLHTDPTDPVDHFRRDSFIQLALRRYF